MEERYHIGNFSRLDYQQAKVDFNADSAQYMKQQELVVTSRINLNELMAVQEVNRPLRLNDSIITVNDALNYDELWSATLRLMPDYSGQTKIRLSLNWTTEKYCRATIPT